MMDKRVSTIVWAAACAVTLATAPTALGNMNLPEEVQAALTENAQNLSPLDLSLAARNDSTQPHDDVARELGMPRPERFFAETAQRTVWQEGKIYMSRHLQTETGDQVEYAFDGEVFYNGSRAADEANAQHPPVLSKQLMEGLVERRPESRLFNMDYFDAVGLTLPSQPRSLQEAPEARSVVMDLVSDAELAGVDEVVVDGRRLTRVEIIGANPLREQAEAMNLEELERLMRGGRNSDEFIEQELETIRQMRASPEERVFLFYLDPELNYAVRSSEERYPDGQLLKRVRNAAFEKLPGREVWLPREVEVDFHTHPSTGLGAFEEPTVTRRFDVLELSVNESPDERFVLNYTAPGTQVSDDTAGAGQVVYEILAGPGGE